MLHKARDVQNGRKVSPPQITYMTSEQQAEYLKDLRTNRPSRPTGSRPLPSKAYSTSTYSSGIYQHENVPFNTAPPNEELQRSSTDISHRRVDSSVSAVPSINSRASIGRPLVQGPSVSMYDIRRKTSPSVSVEPSSQTPHGQFKESGARWLERRESISLRNALEELDIHNDSKLYSAAQQEAADLVWKHRNPRAAEEEQMAPYLNPDLRKVNGAKESGVQGLHSRSQSLGYNVSRDSYSKRSSYRSASGSSTGSNGAQDRVKRQDLQARSNSPAFSAALSKFESDGTRSHAKKRNRVSFGTADSTTSTDQHKSDGQRNVSDGSTKGLFRNPDDEIYEEPEELAVDPLFSTVDRPKPLRVKSKNAVPQGSRPLLVKSSTTPMADAKPFNRYEIHKNSPTQSRDGGYKINTSTPPRTRDSRDESLSQNREPIEKRGDDIRAATSMRLKDRSPKLPTPTIVSDRPGRPIVSFERGWKPKEDTRQSSFEDDSVQNSQRPPLNVPAMTISEPIIPTIKAPDTSGPTIPTINVSDSTMPAIPTINVPDEDGATPIINIQTDTTSDVPSMTVSPSTRDENPSPKRPLPKPSKTSPLPRTKQGGLPWLNRSAHITPTARSNVPTAICANCALPISGRIVTASGSGSASLKARFHPECFTCYHCATALECVAFYPEPQEKRQARLEEQAQELGLASVEELGEAVEKELRFICHLDFHEFFSPRCKSCKTPIEGEVIVAAGGEYHTGHFFCAECGDPFDSNTPFVEHNGYAYCVRCHTRRTSARCRGCKNQVLDEITVSALGGSWHENCFKCFECEGGFGEDGRFFVRQIEREGTEKEKRTGIFKGGRFEEKPVCEGCEGRRLKA